MRASISLLVLTGSLVFATFASAQSYTIDRFTITGGGGTSAGGPLSVSGIIGQPDAGSTMSGGNFTLDGGFWGIIAAVQPPADADGDGLLDSWEQTFFGNLNQTAAGDFDGDGQNNLAEFLSGTDPTNNASAFRITAITRVAGTNMLVTWTMGPGKTNALQRAAGTASGSYSNNFADLFTVIDTVGTTASYLDVGAAGVGSTSRFYRVRLVP